MARHPLSGRELALASACFAAIGFVVFAGHVRHGGFYYDDWGILSVVHFPTRLGALHALTTLYGRRPGQVLWYAALESVLGSHPHQQLALAAVLLVVEVVCLYAVLRRLGMERLAAGSIATLVLLFPFSDSLWLWSILTTNTLTTALYLIGILLALEALETRGWLGIAEHALSLSLYLVGIFTYGESFAVLGCLVGGLYVHAVGWRRARTRWAVDVVAVVASLVFTRMVLPKDIVTPYPRLSLHHVWLHAGEIVSAGGRILAAAAEPFGKASAPLVLGLLAALLIARARDRRFAAVALAGSLIALAAWAVYVPADYIYSPGSPGTGNRVNGLAGIGIAIFLFGAAMLVLRRRVPALILMLVLAAGYTHRLTADARVWDRAASEQARVITTIAEHLARVPEHASFFVADWPLAAGPGVPVYGEPYYLSGALKLAFADRTLAGAQLDSTTRFSCGPRHATASHLPYAQPLIAEYGHAYLVDVRAESLTALSDESRCLRERRIANG